MQHFFKSAIPPKDVKSFDIKPKEQELKTTPYSDLSYGYFLSPYRVIDITNHYIRKQDSCALINPDPVD